MKIDLDYKFGQIIYLRNDPEQIEYLLSRIFLGQKGLISLELFDGIAGVCFEVAEIFTSKVKDVLKASGIEKKDEEI